MSGPTFLPHLRYCWKSCGEQTSPWTLMETGTGEKVGGVWSSIFLAGGMGTHSLEPLRQPGTRTFNKHSHILYFFFFKSVCCIFRERFFS
jgi:hypothetical protein